MDAKLLLVILTTGLICWAYDVGLALTVALCFVAGATYPVWGKTNGRL